MEVSLRAEAAVFGGGTQGPYLWARWPISLSMEYHGNGCENGRDLLKWRPVCSKVWFYATNVRCHVSLTLFQE